MTYDPAGHALLSAAAQALSSEQLTALAEAAELELGLAGTSFTGEDGDRATLAVVYWINCHLASESAGGVVESRSEKKGNEAVSVRFAKGVRLADPCTKAWLLARALLQPAGSYKPLVRIR